MKTFKQVGIWFLAAVFFGCGVILILFYLSSANNRNFLIPGLAMVTTGLIIGSIGQCCRRAKSRQRSMERHIARSGLMALQNTGNCDVNQQSTDEPPSYSALYSVDLSLSTTSLNNQHPSSMRPSYSRHHLPGVEIEIYDSDNNSIVVGSTFQNDTPPTYTSAIDSEYLPSYNEASTI